MKKSVLVNAFIAGALVLLIVLLFGCVQPPIDGTVQTPESLLKNAEKFLDQNVKVHGVLGQTMCTELACIPANICCNSCSSTLKGITQSITVSGKDCSFKGLEAGKETVLEGVWKKNSGNYYLELQSQKSLPEEDVWLSIIPIQCGGNAWDIWHKDLNRVYIRAPTEKEIMSEWLQTVYGVQLLDYKSVKISDVVCQACSCSRGNKVFIKVSNVDAGKLNWIMEEPPVEEITKYSCVNDGDCTKTVLGCCACNEGGKEEAVNQLWLETYNWPDCSENFCPEVFMCTERQAFCEQEKCVLK